MIKLFDFKFLILLGLTLIVYFIYREVEHQRERISECENKISKLLSEQQPIKQISNIVNVDGTINLPPKSNNLSLTLPVNNNDIEETSDDNTTDDNKISSKFIEETDKHLEIYSNDNDNNIETSITDSMIKTSKILSETSDLHSPSTSEIKKSLSDDNNKEEYKINYDEKSKEELLKMKVIELQEYAKNMKISIDKKVNGKTIKKKKEELLEEIIQCKKL